MKITMTELELQDALMHGAPVPAGYTVAGVEFQKYSADFCAIRLDKIAPAEPALLPFADLPAELPALDAAA